MFFGRKKNDCDKLEEKINRLDSEIGNFRLDLERIKTHIQSLRGLVNRRLGKAENIVPEENIKSPDGLDELRKR